MPESEYVGVFPNLVLRVPVQSLRSRQNARFRPLSLQLRCSENTYTSEEFSLGNQ